MTAIVALNVAIFYLFWGVFFFLIVLSLYLIPTNVEFTFAQHFASLLCKLFPELV